MAWPHLFEFMDQDWLPSSLRGTLREILEVGCSRPFRPYYEWVAAEVLAAARETGCQRVVELGAGPAPVTKVMAPDPASDGLQLIVSDRNPDRPEYEALEKKWPGKVRLAMIRWISRCRRPGSRARSYSYPPCYIISRRQSSPRF